MIFKTFHKDIKVSQIVLGTDSFGTYIPEEDAFCLLDRYIDLGGNTIDTARMYGMQTFGEPGKSEIAIGKWLCSRGGRDKIVISSKCAHPPREDMTKSRLSEKEIERDIDESLLSLKTDYIDILWLHRDDVRVPVEGIIDALNRMVQKGKIRAFGGSNWTAQRFSAADEYAKKSGQQTFCASQLKWSAAATSPSYTDDPTLVEMDAVQYDYYKKTKMPVFAYASQAKGFFYQYHKGGETALSKKARERYLSNHNTKVYRKLADLSEKLGITLAAATIAAITSNTDFDTVAVVGCKNIAQLEDTMTGSDVALNYDEIKSFLGV